MIVWCMHNGSNGVVMMAWRLLRSWGCNGSLWRQTVWSWSICGRRHKDPSLIRFWKRLMSLGLPFKIFRFHMLVENCNKVAHLLAKQVTSTNHSERWYVTPACRLHRSNGYTNTNARLPLQAHEALGWSVSIFQLLSMRNQFF